MPLLLLFILVPIIEIALFIQVGGFIGLWPTLGIVVLTAVIGTYMLRQQGLAELARLRSSLENLNDPTDSLAHGAMIIFAGALLLTPGFFTDTIGFLLLIPGFRRLAISWLRSRFRIVSMQSPSVMHRNMDYSSDIIEGEFQELSPGHESQGNSGWTRH